MEDINNLGTFSSINAVWKAHPEGGHEGDYLTISGVKYRWNKYLRIWENSSVVTSTLSRKTETVGGDLIVNNDAVVGDELLVRGNSRFEGDMAVEGMLYAKKVKQPNKGFYQNAAALTARYPSPEVGWWATVGDVMPGVVYRCETEGIWNNTGRDGGVDPEEVSFDIINNLDSIDEHKALSAAMGKKLLGKTRVGYSLMYNNSDIKGVRAAGNIVVISNNGFGLKIANEDTFYYVAPQAGTGDVCIQFDVTSPNNLLVLDKEQLTIEKGRNNPLDCMSVLQNVAAADVDLSRYIPVYYYNKVTGRGFLLGQFKDLFGSRKENIEKKRFFNYKDIFDVDFTKEPSEKDVSDFSGLSNAQFISSGMRLTAGIQNAIMYNRITIFSDEAFKLKL